MLTYSALETSDSASSSFPADLASRANELNILQATKAEPS